MYTRMHKPAEERAEGGEEDKEEEVEGTSPGEGNRSPDLQGPVAPSPRRRQTCQVALGKANIGGTSR